MRRNNRQKPSNNLDRFDRVYVDIPQCPWLRCMVAVPLKTIFYNSAAEENANIDRLFTSVYDLELFITRYRIGID